MSRRSRRSLHPTELARRLVFRAGRAAVATGATAAMLSGLYVVVPELGRPRGPSRSPRTLTREWLAATLVSAARVGLSPPLGRPRARSVAARPVVLVHGYAMDGSNFVLLRRRLERAGIGPFFSFDYWSLGSIARASEELANFIDEVRGDSMVDVIGHSLGGVICRHLVALGRGREQIGTLVSIASPHNGTHTARYCIGGARRHLAPDSGLLRDLDAAAWPTAVRHVSLWSRADGVVQPAESARLAHAEEIVYDDLGHLSLLMSRKVAADITALLLLH